MNIAEKVYSQREFVDFGYSYEKRDTLLSSISKAIQNISIWILGDPYLERGVKAIDLKIDKLIEAQNEELAKDQSPELIEKCQKEIENAIANLRTHDQMVKAFGSWLPSHKEKIEEANKHLTFLKLKSLTVEKREPLKSLTKERGGKGGPIRRRPSRKSKS